MEGYMTRRVSNPSTRVLKLNRREFLSTAVGMTAAGIVSNVKPSEAPLVAAIQPTLKKAPAPLLNTCANTARRIIEIERRNELRLEAKLPLLPVAKELRRMKETEDSQKFSDDFGRFAAKYSKSVWDEVLKPRREALGDPNWKPKYWSEGVGYQGEVFRILRERFRADKKVIGLVR
jgi:hypothetical protein